MLMLWSTINEFLARRLHISSPMKTRMETGWWLGMYLGSSSLQVWRNWGLQEQINASSKLIQAADFIFLSSFYIGLLRKVLLNRAGMWSWGYTNCVQYTWENQTSLLSLENIKVLSFVRYFSVSLTCKYHGYLLKSREFVCQILYSKIYIFLQVRKTEYLQNFSCSFNITVTNNANKVL